MNHALLYVMPNIRELAVGDLIKPFDLKLLPDAWYYVISPLQSAVRKWILQEAEADVGRIAA
jgi:hypothetical protein